jgi:hypothetical protein
MRPSLQRTQSVASERTPLSDVPSVELNENGDTLLMGRSSSSSHYQLSANRLISRVHVKARYIPASTPLEPNRIEIVCTGWNGLKLHCQGQTWELAKGDSFTSETEGADIMLDVQDARVFVRWPRRDKDRDVLDHLSDSSWDDSPRPRPRRAVLDSELHGSPLRRSTRIGTPESPTPANVTSSSTSLDDFLPGSHDHGKGPVQIYEDPSCDENEAPSKTKVDTSFATQLNNSFSSDLSDPQSDDENEPNEENDPIIHSFGPFSGQISDRFSSFTAYSSKKQSSLLKPVSEKSVDKNADKRSSPSVTSEHLTASSTGTAKNPAASSATDESKAPRPIPDLPPNMSEERIEEIKNHVVNQLAFSRLSSTPLSTILNNLPSEDRKGLSKEQLRQIIESIACVGVIRRQGKDAAGKPLESEYYYTPELDTNDERRITVTDALKKPTLRSCRKQHKVSVFSRQYGNRFSGLTLSVAILLEASSYPLMGNLSLTLFCILSRIAFPSQSGTGSRWL